MKKRNSGFNLVEAIVILAVVLMLAATLFPMYVNYLDDREPRPTCQSNLKQLGLALSQYIQDYNNLYMPNPETKQPVKCGWVDGLWPYTKYGPVFCCPTVKAVDASTAQQEPGGTTYYLNAHLYSLPLSKIYVSPEVISVGEGDRGSRNYACASLRSCVGIGRGGTAVPVSVEARTRHINGCNLLFADGHVKWFVPAKIGSFFNVKRPR